MKAARVYKIPPNHTAKECDHRLNNNLIHEKYNKPKKFMNLRVYRDNDEIKTQIIPRKKPTDLVALWPSGELERLRGLAKVVTLEERKAMFEEAQNKKHEEQQACEERKEMMRQAQIRQDVSIGTKLNKIDNEATERNEYLLQRSYELLNEQDDRVKTANCIILATKCRAIRSEQIKEKELIRKQMQQESRRLDDIMEQSRQKSLKEEKEKAEMEEKKLKRFGDEIRKQIEENETEKLVLAEKIEEESRARNRALMAMRRDDERKVKEQKEAQQRMRDAFNQANIELEKYKLVQMEEQRIADLRVQEFMRKKVEREEARERELAMITAAKEKEIARLRAQQQSAQDKQAQLDEMQAIRNREEVERAWRKKEKEAAIKRIQDLNNLHAAREKQIADVRASQALTIARDKADFEKVVRVQQEEFEKDQKKLALKRENNMQHRKEILKQINDRERQRLNAIALKFEDGKAVRLGQEVQDDHIRSYIKGKLGKLRETPLPPTYTKDIERQLKLNKLI